MGDELLDYVLWRVAKWYIRRKLSSEGRKLAIAGVAGAVLIGGAAALLRRGEDE